MNSKSIFLSLGISLSLCSSFAQNTWQYPGLGQTQPAAMMNMNGMSMNSGIYQPIMDPALADPQMGLSDPWAYTSQQPGADPAMQMDAPGIVNPFSIQSLVQNANSRVSSRELDMLKAGVQSYVDGNMADARNIFTRITEEFQEGVATDRAYLGLAKIERAYGAYDVSRRILEAVIRKNRDYESIMLARRSYRDLEQEVKTATSSAAQEMEFSYARYKQISWFDFFTKIKSYNQYKDSKSNYEALLISQQQFDPIFSMVNITSGIPSANQAAVSTPETIVPTSVENKINSVLSADDLKRAFSTTLEPATKNTTWLNPNPVNTAPVAQPEIMAPQTAVQPTVPAPAPELAATPEKPINLMSLDEARQAYLSSYEQLKEALKGDNAELKRKLQADYKAALERFNQLKNESR